MIQIQMSRSSQKDNNELFVLITVTEEGERALTPGVVSEILRLDVIRGVVQVNRGNGVLCLSLVVNGAPGAAAVAKAAAMAMAIECLLPTPTS